jgi:hypothetical protein
MLQLKAFMHTFLVSLTVPLVTHLLFIKTILSLDSVSLLSVPCLIAAGRLHSTFLPSLTPGTLAWLKTQLFFNLL